MNIEASLKAANDLESKCLQQSTQDQYKSKMFTATRIMKDNIGLFPTDPFIRDIDGNLQYYINTYIYIIKLPLALDNARAFFGIICNHPDLLLRVRDRNYAVQWINNNESDNTNNNNNNNADNNNYINAVENRATISASCAGGFRSALKFWHTYKLPDKESIEWDENTILQIGKILQGHKREIGRKKRLGIMNIKEGKDAFTLEGYAEICKALYKLRPDGHKYTFAESLFANLYIRLQWHTIGRSDNVEDLMSSHISWDVDAATVTFATTKADPEGERTNEKKHLYCNPFKPELCMILAFAIYVL